MFEKALKDEANTSNGLQFGLKIVLTQHRQL